MLCVLPIPSDLKPLKYIPSITFLCLTLLSSLFDSLLHIIPSHSLSIVTLVPVCVHLLLLETMRCKVDLVMLLLAVSPLALRTMGLFLCFCESVCV